VCGLKHLEPAAAPPVDKAPGTSCSVSSDVAAGPLALRRLASPPLASPALAPSLLATVIGTIGMGGITIGATKPSKFLVAAGVLAPAAEVQCRPGT
jgi:hypothetical protein